MSQDEQQRDGENLKQRQKDLEKSKNFSATEWRDISTRYDRYALAVCGGGFVLFLHLLTSVTASFMTASGVFFDAIGWEGGYYGPVYYYDYIGMINLILLLFLISITLTLARKAFAAIVHIKTLKAIEQGKSVNMHQARSWATAATSICLYSSAIAMLVGLATAFIFFFSRIP